MTLTLHQTGNRYTVGGLPSGRTYEFEVAPESRFKSFNDFAERYLAPIESIENNIPSEAIVPIGDAFDVRRPNKKGDV